MNPRPAFGAGIKGNKMQRKPRNPLVPAMMRRTGADVHGTSGKAKRLADRNTLRRELCRRDDAASVQRIAVR